MEQEEQFQFKNNIIVIPLLFVFAIWFVYWVEIKFGFNFNKLGVLPRTLKGFKGVFLSHFIHSDTKHLFNNSVPLTVLLMALFYFYKEVGDKLLIIGGLLTGLLTWIIGREAYHFGASGLVYLLFSFIFFSGIIRKHFRLVAMSLIVIFLYGSMIWYLFPIEKGISWEGHLSGFLVGLIFAIYYRKVGIVKEKFVFSKTEFDEMFDEEGNYVPPVLEEEQNFEEINYRYIYLPNVKEEEE
ncbi:rhomboid family intramembrane serine protease [uncultured Tenacibaculum sp.]|uniref:rhomboid family intramembrane serine protease n=1 Tax=uncultured Tenacibaculum sp. TaxID=174713 RepID=UPI00262853C8|nr:rhomboid family intramembrane serine protease [uncultured Tenacibaculum sp.]